MNTDFSVPFDLDREDFLEHMHEAGAELTKTEDQIETWQCMYAGRDHVLAGTYNLATEQATLDLL